MATPAEDLLEIIVKSAEGTRKEGFTVGGVSWTINQAQDQVTGTFILPVTITTDATTKALTIEAQDYLELPDWATTP